LPNTLSVNFPQINAGALLRRIPELCASTGAACHSGSENPSPTLAAIGLIPQTAQGTVRLSLGWYTNQEEIDRAANLLLSAWEAEQN
jgi:cysteine desulfurase